MVEVRNLSFSYSARRILKDVSFSVAPGERVCIVGSNGAGKSTLMNILATLAVPDSGTVTFDGLDIFSRQLRYRRQLGYLPEKFALYEDMTVKDFLVYRANLKGEPPKRVRRRVKEASETCLVSGLMRSRIRFLSAGEKKRVALADALMLRPRVLLLDDFLSGLDCGMREAVGDILSDVAAFSAVIATGHEVGDFSGWATRFLVLGNGTIADTVEVDGSEDRETLCSRIRSAASGGVK